MLKGPEYQEKQESKKRKRKDFDNADSENSEEDQEMIMKEFEHESQISHLYESKFIDVKEELQSSLYVSLNVKNVLYALDQKKEVVLTMLNQLEKLEPEKAFFRVDSILPIGI